MKRVWARVWEPAPVPAWAPVLAGGTPRPDGLERDDFDALCEHVLVEETRTGRLLCTFRLLPLSDGGEIGRSYSAQFYVLDAL